MILSPASGESFTLGSVLIDTGGNTNRLLKVGLGSTILPAANTYSGGTIIGGGVLRVNADSALGAATGEVMIDNGATLQAGGTITSNRAFTFGTGGGKSTRTAIR